MTEHNHVPDDKCDRFCPAHPLYKTSIMREELEQARDISKLTVEELLNKMTPEQTKALRDAAIAGETAERDAQDWEDEEEPFGDPPQVSSAVTNWLHQFEKDAYNRGVTDGQGMRAAKDAEKIAALNQRVADLEKLLGRNKDAANDRDEYVARLQVIAELCNRPINDPIGERVADLDVFAQRMRRFGQEFISRNDPDGDQLIEALVQYATGRKPTDVPAR